VRVTSSMLINNFLRNLNNNLSRLERTQNRLSTGKRISRPSDDPAGLAYSMGLRANLAALERYQKNVDTAKTWLEAIDSALDSATNILHRAKDLAIYGASDTVDEQSREALAKEVGQLLEEMRQIANTSSAGRYIFAGNNTLEEPYPSSEDFTYAGTNTERTVEIGENIIISYSVTGDRVFGDSSTGILKTLQDLREALEGSEDLNPGDLIGDLEAGLDHILSIRAEVGARVNRLELVNNRLEDTHFSYTRLLSETENADIAETIIELKAQENVYLASLGAGARIIQPSLLDFLR
jgi:flagellar hook-associated protein 3 FlgL